MLCPIAPLIHSRLSAVVGRSGWQITGCVASINSTSIRYNVSYKCNLGHTAPGSRLFGSVVRTLDFYPGGLVSIPIWDVGFFQTMHQFLVMNFHIRKIIYLALFG